MKTQNHLSLGTCGSLHLHYFNTKNFITVQRVPCPVFYGTCYYDESDDDMSSINFEVPNNDFDDSKECVFYLPYYNAFYEDPMLLDNCSLFNNYD
jgi:hypothetical protein